MAERVSTFNPEKAVNKWNDRTQSPDLLTSDDVLNMGVDIDLLRGGNGINGKHQLQGPVHFRTIDLSLLTGQSTSIAAGLRSLSLISDNGFVEDQFTLRESSYDVIGLPRELIVSVSHEILRVVSSLAETRMRAPIPNQPRGWLYDISDSNIDRIGRNLWQAHLSTP